MKYSKMAIVRKVASQALHMGKGKREWNVSNDRAVFVREWSLILGQAWDKDQDKLQELIWDTMRDTAFSLANLEIEKDPRTPRPSKDGIKIDEQGNYLRHEGVNVPEEVKRQEHSSLTAQERADDYQIFVVMSVYDDEICEEYQSQDEADIAASRFTQAVVIRRYSKREGLEAEDWTYGPSGGEDLQSWRAWRDRGYEEERAHVELQRVYRKDPKMSIQDRIRHLELQMERAKIALKQA
jgi:hypothetical protein